MDRVMPKRLEKALEEAGFDADARVKIRKAVEPHLPDMVYRIAVSGLVVVAVVLALVFAAAILLDKTIQGEYWVTLGACVGGLAGIFAGQKTT
jgi:hypothetical protein